MVLTIITFYGLIIAACTTTLAALVLFCNLNIRRSTISKLPSSKKIYFKKLYSVFGIMKETSYLLPLTLRINQMSK